MNRLQMLCRRALCVPIRIYQYTLSPWIGRSCRFSPSCSNYTMQAILTHGCVKGILLGAWRIARCNPLGKWGYVWFIGQTNASTARSLVISGTSLNLQTKTNQEAAKDIYLNVRCVKNYTK